MPKFRGFFLLLTWVFQPNETDRGHVDQLVTVFPLTVKISVRQSRFPEAVVKVTCPCCLTAVVSTVFSGSIRDLMQTFVDLQSCKL